MGILRYFGTQTVGPTFSIIGIFHSILPQSSTVASSGLPGHLRMSHDTLKPPYETTLTK